MFLASGSVALLMFTAIAAEPKELAFEFKSRKQGDTIELMKPEKDKPTVLLVTGKSGIGGGTLTLTGGEWPGKVVIRFQYEAKSGFKDLEQFTISTTRMEIQGSIKESGRIPFMLLDADGKAIAKEEAGLLRIVVDKQNDYVDVILPAYLLVGSKEIKLSWVDQLR